MNVDTVRPSKKHLTSDDYRILVGWVEIKENFEAINGTSGKMSVDGRQKPAKAVAFGKTAAHLQQNRVNRNLPHLTARTTQQRWSTYMTKFRAVLKQSQPETGEGLIEEDLAAGISLPAKWEQLCHHFSRMTALFRDRPNIKPAALLEMGAVSASADRACVGGAPHNCYDSGHDSERMESDNGSTSSGSPSRVLATAPATPFAIGETPTRRPSITSQSEAPTSAALDYNRQKRQKMSKHQLPQTTHRDHATEQQPKVDNHASLSQAYAGSMDMKMALLKEKLDQEKQQWREAQAERKLKRNIEIEEKQRARNHELLLELARQNKTADEIGKYYQMHA